MINEEKSLLRRTAPEQDAPQHTGWAILTAIALSLVFYALYRMLFTFVVGIYASYDPRFASGLGALVLVVFGSNILGFLSGTVVARRLFTRASGIGLFYGLATALVIICLISILTEMGRYDWSLVAVAVNLLITGISIMVVKITLLR